eukprot:8360775-Alexandrium_andersonii.AAC.1
MGGSEPHGLLLHRPPDSGGVHFLRQPAPAGGGDARKACKSGKKTELDRLLDASRPDGRRPRRERPRRG